MQEIGSGIEDDESNSSPTTENRHERSLYSQNRIMEGLDYNATYDFNVHEKPNHQLFSLRNDSICDYQRIMSNVE